MVRVKFLVFVMAVGIASLTTACGVVQAPTPIRQPMGGMPVTTPISEMDETGAIPTVPPVKGYAEGQEIFFIHTEASDPQVAEVLTGMMGSPVLVVPSLALAPETMLAKVFVFTNGIQGGGPMGFQPDVFDRPPGDPGYTPLRALQLVTWKDPAAARELKSAAEIRAAEAKGQVTISLPGVVINMPFLTWPAGHR